MHKFISIIISMLFVLSLTACGSTEAPLTAGSATKDEVSLSGEVSGEITVSIYDTMMYRAFLEDAARLFEKKYPGTSVNIEAFSAMPDIKTGDGNVMVMDIKDDPQSKQDYINRMNTVLMGGGGPDILAMDILPFYKYADGGHLENLADYIQADPAFNKVDYRTNIWDALQYQEGIWFFPIDYAFNFYAYNSAQLTGSIAGHFGTDEGFTAEELIALAEPFFDGSTKIFDRPDYTNSPRPDMWELLLEENYTSFVDMKNKKANFNNGNFEKLLESVKRYGEQGYLFKGEIEQEGIGMMPRTKEEAAEQFFFRPKNVLSLIAFFTRELGMTVDGMGEGNTMAIGDYDEIAGIIAAADDSVPFTYSQAYSINSNSKNKETAWAFLKFLLSEEMQLNTNLRPTGLPILNSAREQKMERLLTSMMGQQGQSLSEAILEAGANYHEAAEKLSDQIDAYVIRDTVVDDMIAAEVQYFFEGTKTAADVASVLQNKVELYLNE